VALGRALAALLPEDRFDRQPLIGGGGRFALVADVRLDNRAELASALGIPVAPLAEMADSAVLLAAWERWEEESCERMIGDFAFALWDDAERRLVLTRDYLGARPLHFYEADDAFAFASMPKGLHALEEIAREPDLEFAANSMAYRAPLGTRTLYRDVQRVLPGHVAIADASGVKQRRYWRPKRVALGLKTAGDYSDALRERLDEAVRARVRGESAVAAHLSAGLDSSAVVTSAALALEGSGRVHAFTSVPGSDCPRIEGDPRLIDEGPIAAATASLYPNVDHVLVDAGGRSPFEDLDRNVFLFDQPAANLCNMPWIYRINDAARAAGLRVLLTGQAGNVGFSYEGLQLLPQLLRSGRLLRLGREMLALRRTGAVGLDRSFARALLPNLPAAAQAGVHRLRGTGHLVGEQSRSAPSPESGFQARLRFFERYDPGSVLKGYLGGWGTDHRDPTADKRLIEFSLSVPEEQFLRDGMPRALARRAIAGRIPPLLLGERRKGLQAADWHHAAGLDRARLAREIDLLAQSEPARQVIEVDRLRTLAQAWPSEGWHRRDVAISYRAGLLRELSLGHFLRVASGKQTG
jgi:asparagine synthase (glutamine-hydrolysing)